MFPGEATSGHLLDVCALSASRVLMEDLSCMSGQVLDAWQRMLAVMPRNLEEVSEWLNASFATLRKRYFV